MPRSLRIFAALFLLACSSCSCEDPAPLPLCTMDSECREGERCTAEGQCVVGAECVREEDCTAKDPRRTCNLTTFTCDFREGFGDECDIARPCPFGEFCSTLLGRCLDASTSRDCVRRAQCPAGQICDRNANKCIPDLGCYGPDFCESGEYCDLVNRTCRAANQECVSCLISNMCEGEALCYVDTKECLVGAAEPECRTGERCDPLGRCVQCTRTSECGPGTFCNVALGRCESNVQCVDDPSQCPSSSEVTCVTCTLPETCDPRTRRCAAPAMPCDSDVDCPNEQICDLTLETPICIPRLPDCLNDLLDEPRNDNFSDATVLAPEAGPLFVELKVCPGDQDWYRIDVQAGTYLTVDARFRHGDGDVELQLYLPDGRTLVDESRSVTDNERVELEVGTDLTLLVRVFLATPTVRAVPYRMIVARDPGDLCMDDDHEPDDARNDAKQLVSDVPFEGRLCPADPDWFVLRNVQPGTQIQLTLEFIDNLGDLDLELYRANGPRPFLSSLSTDDNEQIEVGASYGGDYFVRVIGKAADTNVYRIRAVLREGAAPTCQDDRFEANDTFLTATSTGAIPRMPAELSLCSGDEDWFRVHLGPSEALRAEISFDPGADLDLALYDGAITDPNGSPLRLSNGTTSSEYVAWRAARAGEFLVRVRGHQADDVSPYQLNLKVEPPFFCQPDAIDQQMRGNSLADAFNMALPPTRIDDSTICNGDEDWYRMIFAGGFVNVLRMNFIQTDALLNFDLVDATGALLFSTAGLAAANFREVLINAPGVGFGVLFVRVYRSSGFEAAYDLTLNLIPIFNCAADVAEQNNLRAMASRVASSTVSPVLVPDLTMCTSVRDISNTGDVDWFVINPPAAGARINARIDFTQGDLSLELFSPNGGPRACVNLGEDRCFSDGFGLSEQIAFTATVAAPYFLRVNSVYSSPAVQVRPPEADTPYDLRIEYSTP